MTVSNTVLIDEFAEQSPAIDARLGEPRLIDELDLHGALQRGAGGRELVEHVLQEMCAPYLNVRDLALVERLMHLLVRTYPLLQQHDLLFGVEQEGRVSHDAFEAEGIGLEHHLRALGTQRTALGPHSCVHGTVRIGVSHVVFYF